MPSAKCGCIRNRRILKRLVRIFVQNVDVGSGRQIGRQIECADLKAEHVPILIGALGDYLTDYDEGTRTYYPVVNRALEAVAESEQPAAFIPASGLTAKPDNLHFNAPSLRTFGLRYYEAFRKLEPPCNPTLMYGDPRTPGVNMGM